MNLYEDKNVGKSGELWWENKKLEKEKEVKIKKGEEEKVKRTNGRGWKCVNMAWREHWENKKIDLTLIWWLAGGIIGKKSKDLKYTHTARNPEMLH